MDSTFSGTIKHIVYINKENGYSVLRTNDGKALCGIIDDASANLNDADFTAAGVWKNHKKYGMQFMFKELKINESDLFYFLCRIVKGIGKKLAHSLLALYKEDELVRILDSEPEKLLKVKGIKEKKLERITDSWNKFRELKNLSEILVPHGATPALVLKVYKHFSDEPLILETIKDNPYIITEIKGIGFKTADVLALRMGVLPDSIYRIKACINYILVKTTTDEGNSCIKKQELYQKNKIELDNFDNIITEKFFNDAMLELISEKKIILLHDEYVTSAFLYKVETGILENIKKRLNVPEIKITENFEEFIKNKQVEMNIQFSEEQIEAVKLVNNGINLFMLCGYAGTGKTTISRAILELLSIRYNAESIVCCALSGIASDRIRKTTGYNSHTIASLIVQAGKKGGRFPCKVLLIDEASMINSELLYRLFCILDDDCTVIMVGDPAQLPPIGAGDPFFDIIDKKIAPVVELTKIYRQDENQVIAYFANIIRQGIVPDNFTDVYTDFQFIDVSIKNYFALKNKLNAKEKTELRNNNSEAILKSILNIASEYKSSMKDIFNNRDMRRYIIYFQIITPMKKGILGTGNLNNQMQELLNSQEDIRNVINLGIIKLNLYDKVVHISNQDMDCYNPVDFKKSFTKGTSFKQRIYNGMIGLLFKINRQDELLWIYYPADEIVAEYGFEDARELLRLSYVLTIHKTQGSEYENVIIPMSFSHFIMLNNKLLYTAVTRAKSKCCIIGEHYAFSCACKRKDVTVRNTVIGQVV